MCTAPDGVINDGVGANVNQIDEACDLQIVHHPPAIILERLAVGVCGHQPGTVERFIRPKQAGRDHSVQPVGAIGAVGFEDLPLC